MLQIEPFASEPTFDSIDRPHSASSSPSATATKDPPRESRGAGWCHEGDLLGTAAGG